MIPIFFKKLITSFSCSNKIKKLCAYHKLKHKVTKIGFKYIADIILKNKVLIGGEESGGISIQGHIPERDGIWTAMILIEYIAKSGKSIDQLIKEIYKITGSFCFKRNDLQITQTQKDNVLKMCENNYFQSFDDLKYEFLKLRRSNYYNRLQKNQFFNFKKKYSLHKTDLVIKELTKN